MVHPEPLHVAERPTNGLDEGLVAGRAQLPGDEGRQAPVLPCGVELVRRGADATAVGEEGAEGGTIGPGRVEADRQIADERDGRRGVVDCVELALDAPLQPGVEVGGVGLGGGALLLRAPLGPLPQRRTGAGRPRPPTRVGAVGSLFEQGTERRSFRRPHRVTVDDLGPARVHTRHPEMQGIPPPLARRIVRAVLLMAGRARRVKRAEQDVTAAVGFDPASKGDQIGEVTDALAGRRQHRVELSRDPPAGGRRRTGLRRHHQAGGRATVHRHEVVVADR